MDTKIITEEEKENIKSELMRILKPYSPEVIISDDYYKHYNSVSYGIGSIEKRWEEHVYSFKINTSIGEYRRGHSMHINWTPKEFAWIIGHELFMILDNDINSPLAKNLWK